MHLYEHKIVDDYVKIYFYDKDNNKVTCYVDLEDWDRVRKHKYKWNVEYIHGIPYVTSCIYKGIMNNKPKYSIILLHRFILKLSNKKQNKVDHINHNGLDNRKSNLRIISNENNLKNRKGKNKNNTSGYRNVSWCKSSKKWIVQLQINGKNKVLGRFDDVHEAGKFATKMRKKYYGEYAGKG